MHRVTRWQTKAFVYKFSKIPPRRTLFKGINKSGKIRCIMCLQLVKRGIESRWIEVWVSKNLNAQCVGGKWGTSPFPSVRLFVKAKNLFSHNTDSIDKTDIKSKPTTVREDFFLIFMFLELILATRTSTRKVKVHFSLPYGNLRASLLKQSIVIYILNQFPSNFNLF